MLCIEMFCNYTLFPLWHISLINMWTNMFGIQILQLVLQLDHLLQRMYLTSHRYTQVIILTSASIIYNSLYPNERPVCHNNELGWSSLDAEHTDTEYKRYILFILGPSEPDNWQTASLLVLYNAVYTGGLALAERFQTLP